MGERPWSSLALFLAQPPPQALHPGIAPCHGQCQGTLCLGAQQGTGRLVPPAHQPPGPWTDAGVQGLLGVMPGARGGHAKPARWGDKPATGMDMASPTCSGAMDGDSFQDTTWQWGSSPMAMLPWGVCA